MQWCDTDKKHVGPYFTITVSALEVGPGTGLRKRISARQIVARLCGRCLLDSIISLEGRKLISLEAQDRANG